jgi:hypothetical protein
MKPAPASSVGADRPAHDSPQKPDSPAAFLDSEKAMRRIGHCATVATGLLALKGLRPGLSSLIGEHVAFFAANPERPLREMLFAAA